jgi:hypothetical protein
MSLNWQQTFKYIVHIGEYLKPIAKKNSKNFYHLNSNELNKVLSDEASAVVYKDLPPPVPRLQW